MNYELIVAISGIFIATMALAFTAFQVHLTIKHNKITYRPHLVLKTLEAGIDRRCYSKISNNGLGPALVQNSYLRFDGIKQDLKLYDAIVLVIDKLFSGLKYDVTLSALGKGYSLLPGEDSVLLDIEFYDCEEYNIEDIKEKLSRVDIVIEFTSMYGEKFVFDSKN